jgi:hypothetical protein
VYTTLSECDPWSVMKSKVDSSLKKTGTLLKKKKKNISGQSVMAKVDEKRESATGNATGKNSAKRQDR